RSGLYCVRDCTYYTMSLRGSLVTDSACRFLLRGVYPAGFSILFFFFKQKTAYDIGLGIPAEPLFRSMRRSGLICLARSSRTGLDMSHILFMVEILLLTFKKSVDYYLSPMLFNH